MNLTCEQCRAARCFLDWSREEMAEASGVSKETIKNFEHGEYAPNAATRAAILETFEAHGLEFIDGGVRVCPSCGYPNTSAKERHAETQA
jgi:DNA-binding XRE family transcriptional regulator